MFILYEPLTVFFVSPYSHVLPTTYPSIDFECNISQYAYPRWYHVMFQPWEIGPRQNRKLALRSATWVFHALLNYISFELIKQSMFLFYILTVLFIKPIWLASMHIICTKKTTSLYNKDISGILPSSPAVLKQCSRHLGSIAISHFLYHFSDLFAFQRLVRFFESVVAPRADRSGFNTRLRV